MNTTTRSKVIPSLVMASERMPNVNQKVLWIDSLGIARHKHFGVYAEVASEVGFLFDAWIDVDQRERALTEMDCDVLQVRQGVYDIAPELEEVSDQGYYQADPSSSQVEN